MRRFRWGGQTAGSARAPPPTDIQRLSFGPVSQGRDVFGRSRTGTGKTVAFMLPALQRFTEYAGEVSGGDVSLVVLSNTKELCHQLAAVARGLSGGLKGAGGGRPFAVAVVAGSEGVGAFVSGTPCDMLVATPGVPGPKGGGLAKLLAENAAAASRLANVRTLVLDEGDSLAAGGFLRSVQIISGCMRLPKEPASGRGRLQLLVYSATLPEELRTSSFMQGRDLVVADTVGGAPKPVGDNVTQSVVVADGASHPAVVAAIVQAHAWMRAPQSGGDPGFEERLREQLGATPETFEGFGLAEPLLAAVSRIAPAGKARGAAEPGAWKAVVFCGATLYADYFHAVLQRALAGTATGGLFKLYGGLQPNERKRVMARFTEARNSVLVCTDVVARGIDLPDLTLVVQVGYTSRSDFLQRAGRVGRAGAPGTAFAVFDPVEAAAILRKDCKTGDDRCIGDMLASGIVAEVAAQPSEGSGGVPAQVESDGAGARGVLRFTPVRLEPGALPASIKPARVFTAWLASVRNTYKRLGIREDDVVAWGRRVAAGMGAGLTDDDIRRKLTEKVGRR